MTIPTDVEALLRIAGVSGYEAPVRRYIRSRIDGIGAVREDAMGNLSLTLGSSGPRLLIVAHMDEIGLVVSGIDADGAIRFEKVGTIDDRLLAGHHVEVHTRGGPVRGVIGANPPHLGGSAGASPATLAIDVGTDDAASTRRLGIAPLDSVTFVKVPRVMAGTRLNCRAIDDRVGCALVLWAAEYAAKRTLHGRVTFAWSVQEEVGLRGAQALAASSEQFDAVLAIDACASTDGPNHPKRLANFPLGQGPVLRMVDHGSIASFDFADWLDERASAIGVSLQRGVTGGETDGVPLQTTGAHMVPLTIPMRYVHSLAETCDLRDVTATRRVLERVVDDVAHLARLGS